MKNHKRVYLLLLLVFGALLAKAKNDIVYVHPNQFDILQYANQARITKVIQELYGDSILNYAFENWRQYANVSFILTNHHRAKDIKVEYSEKTTLNGLGAFIDSHKEEIIEGIIAKYPTQYTIMPYKRLNDYDYLFFHMSVARDFQFKRLKEPNKYYSFVNRFEYYPFTSAGLKELSCITDSTPINIRLSYSHPDSIANVNRATIVRAIRKLYGEAVLNNAFENTDWCFLNITTDYPAKHILNITIKQHPKRNVFSRFVQEHIIDIMSYLYDNGDCLYVTIPPEQSFDDFFKNIVSTENINIELLMPLSPAAFFIESATEYYQKLDPYYSSKLMLMEVPSRYNIYNRNIYR